MKRVMCVIWAAALLVPAVAHAQPPPMGQRRTLVEAIKAGYNESKMNLTQAAEKMPESDYSFKPSSMPEMRGYGALFAHVAQAQFGMCSAARGVANPNQGHNLEKEATTKAAIAKALNDSFALCDQAYNALTDANAMEFVKMGRGEIQHAAVLMNNVVHNNEMYGTAAVYLRAKGMVPPSTARGGMMMRGRGGRGR